MRRFLPLVAATLLLGACASIAPERARLSPELLALWQARQQKLAGVDHWDMKGRMAVRTADDAGSATFIWERSGDVHRIEMFGPFGSGRVTITQDANGAVLRDGDDEPVSADSAEELLYYQVGWHVPFESLKYWLKGLPSPGPHDSLVLDAQGRALGFHQDGWEVAIIDYEAGDPADLPRKVFIKALPGTVHLVGEHGEDLGDRLDVKVVLRRWQLLPG
jgi:outer membrane lipoprotein LolB